MARTLILVTSLWSIAVGGWRMLPTRADGCGVCGLPPIEFAAILVTLACGFVSLLAALVVASRERGGGHPRLTPDRARV
jgi:hypothetical protein